MQPSQPGLKNTLTASVLELWGMQRTPSLPLLPGPLWPRVVPPERVLSMGEIGLFDHLTVCIYKMCLQIIYLICI